jgi:hypothetical protein
MLRAEFIREGAYQRQVHGVGNACDRHECITGGHRGIYFSSCHPDVDRKDHSPLKTRAGHHLLAIANPLPVG